MPIFKIINIQKDLRAGEPMYVPLALPNNIKLVRENFKKLSLQQMSDQLQIAKNFLATVEAQDQNFSGKTAVRFLKEYGINFYTLYDIQEKRVCPASYEETMELSGVFEVTKREILEEMNKKAPSNEDILKYLTMKSSIVEATIKEELEKSSDSIVIDKVSIGNETIDNDKIILEVQAWYREEKRVDEHEFNINFENEQDEELTKILRRIGYPETVTTVELEVDGETVTFDNGNIILDKEYKIPGKSKYLSDFSVIKEINIEKDKFVEVKTSKGIPTSVKFKAIRPELNNLRALRILSHLSVEDVHPILGLSASGYLNLELGNQKLSSKVMWRIVNHFKVPLEAVINIDEYFERLCKHKRIVKGRRKATEE